MFGDIYASFSAALQHMCGVSFILFISVFVVLLRTDAGFHSYRIRQDLKENLRGSGKLLHQGLFYCSCLDSHSVFRFACGLAVYFYTALAFNSKSSH